MATVRTAIELQDNFTNVLYQVINSVNLGLSAMEDLHRTMNAPVDTTSIDAARDSINQATIAVQELDAAMQGIETPTTDSPTAPDSSAPVQLPVEPVVPDPIVEPQEPVQVPVVWQSDNMEVFTGTGVERFEQEVQSANNMLNTLNSTQERISKTAAQTNLFPANAVSDMNNMGNRLQVIQQRIQQIESNPLNMGTATANSELEQLRGQLNQAVQEQENLNRAVENMDVQAANEAYLRLSQTVGNTERYIRDNVDEQGRFNQKINEGVDNADNLMNAIKGAVAAYATAQTAKKILDLSDTLTSTTARLNLMNDGLQTTEDLQNMIYLSAERSRGAYQATADAVSKLGLMAGDAFGSSAEIVAFMEQINKQFTIAGTETAGIEAAMLQLTQAMGSGVLRGEEYNSILEQAPNIIQAIADYMDVPKGQLKDMAAEGQITADIVKAAMFAAADETNAKFESMPMTFSQIWTSFQNTALMAFQPILNRLSEIANSDAFQTFVNNAVTGLSTVAGIALEIFNLLVSVASAVADNWSWLSPIIYGVAAALIAYYTALGIYNGIQLVSNGIKAAAAFMEKVHAASLAMETGATFAATAAQYGFNAALLACPITWIIIGIIALIAVIFAVCNAIAKLTGVANTGFGIITGGINVVIQFYKNLFLTVVNIALGISNAIEAVASNMMSAFREAIGGIQSWFYDLLSTALTVIEGICAALNKLPFVQFDYSGISNAAADYASKSAAAMSSKGEYVSVADAFKRGMSTFDTFQSGWASDAFSAGASWGDGVADKISGMLGDLGGIGIPTPSDYADLSNYIGETGAGNGIGETGAGNGIGNDVGDIAGNTGKIADSLDVTEEDLKYLRDIAEQEAINRFTTAEIKIEQTNHNNVTGEMDLDGVVIGLTDAVNEAISIITEGVHK